MRWRGPALVALFLVSLYSEAARAEPRVYDLRPFSVVAPELERARAALQQAGPDGASLRSQALAGLDARLSAPAEPVEDPLVRLTARWLRSRLLALEGDAKGAREELEALAGAPSSIAQLALWQLAGEARLQGDDGRAADLLLRIRSGAEAHRAALEEALRLKTKVGGKRAAAEALAVVLAGALPKSERARLTMRAAKLWGGTGNSGRARALLFGIWWEDPEGLGPAASSSLKRLGVETDYQLKVARAVLSGSHRRAGRARKRLRSLRKARSKGEKRAMRWAEAVLDAHEDDPDGALARLGRLRAKLARDRFEPYFQLGRAMALRGLDRDLEAAEQYRRVAQRWPDHPLADRARMEAARLLERRGQPLEAEGLYREVIRRPDSGWEHARALWRLGLAAFLAGRYGDARAHWAALLERFAYQSEAPGISWQERAGYWMARAAEKEGRAEEARAAYRELALRFPISWYAQLARARSGAARADNAPEQPEGAPGRLAGLRIVRAPAMDLAISHLRWGDLGRAQRSLETLLAAGALPGSGRALLAALCERAGQPQRAARALKWRSIPAARPTPSDRDLYTRLFPAEYASRLSKAAREQGVPSPLLAALVHIESRYNPHARSPVGAIGLTQLMPRTARSTGRHLLGREVTAADLRRPEVNLAIGGRFFRELLEHFGGSPALALAAYNAGHVAVRRWLQARGHMELDAFVEAIPYRQTRNYVRRVMSVAELYSALTELPGAELPADLRLPLTLGPFFEERGQPAAAH